MGVTLNGIYIDIYVEEKPEHYTGSPSITIRVKPSEYKQALDETKVLLDTRTGQLINQEIEIGGLQRQVEELNTSLNSIGLVLKGRDTEVDELKCQVNGYKKLYSDHLDKDVKVYGDYVKEINGLRARAELAEKGLEIACHINSDFFNSANDAMEYCISQAKEKLNAK